MLEQQKLDGHMGGARCVCVRLCFCGGDYVCVGGWVGGFVCGWVVVGGWWVCVRTVCCVCVGMCACTRTCARAAGARACRCMLACECVRVRPCGRPFPFAWRSRADARRARCAEGILEIQGSSTSSFSRVKKTSVFIKGM